MVPFSETLVRLWQLIRSGEFIGQFLDSAQLFLTGFVMAPTADHLLEFVGRFVNLRKAGVNWKGLCPFHGEKTPSFMVNPKKAIFHCFGCGVGGDVFGFVMRQDRLSFPEAVRALAKTAGVTLPEERGAAPDSGREELLRAMDLAARFYAEALWKPAGAHAQKYLADRGIDPEVARALGWATHRTAGTRCSRS